MIKIILLCLLFLFFEHFPFLWIHKRSDSCRLQICTKSWVHSEQRGRILKAIEIEIRRCVICKLGSLKFWNTGCKKIISGWFYRSRDFLRQYSQKIWRQQGVSFGFPIIDLKMILKISSHYFSFITFAGIVTNKVSPIRKTRKKASKIFFIAIEK